MNERRDGCLIRTKLADSTTLTTIFRYPAGGPYRSWETGIRKGESFQLVQHGWPDWRRAHGIVLACVAKGWDDSRITKLMEFLEDHRRGKFPRPRED